MTIQEEIKAFKALTTEMATTFAAKRKDYGQTTTETYERFGPVAMLTRIYDKYGRIENLLLHNEHNCVDEAIEDTLMDLANYALITLLEVRKHN